MTDQEFIDLVKEEMSEFNSRGIIQEGDQFSVWFLTKILGESDGDSIEQYHIGGAGDNKLDIGIINDGHSSIIVGQCKYSSSPLSTTFDTDLPEEAKNAVDRLISIPEAGNEKRKSFAQKFARRDKPVRILAVGFGKVSKSAFLYAKRNKIEIYDLDKIKTRYIYNEVMEHYNVPDVIAFDIDYSNCIKQDIETHGLKQWIFLLPISEIYKIVSLYKDGVFQLNLRFRLEKSAKSGIGKEIYDSILSDSAPAFSILNNGLTIVADRVEDQEGKLQIFSPQIVNGCQSSWAIYDAVLHLVKGGQDLDDLETKVLVKLVETSEDQITTTITQSTNKQNPIDDRDIHSNDEYQIHIAREFKNFNPSIFYDHRAGLWESIVRDNQQSQYRVSGKRYRTIDNEFCGQIYLALLGKPFYSKQYKQKIFDDSDYYSVIYKCNISRTERFASDVLNITPEKVHLSSGYNSFVKDVIFGYAIYRLADAVKERYRRKISMYPEEPQGTQESAYNLLKDKYFLVTWHFLLIAIVNHIVFSWKKHGKDVDAIREELIGNKINIFWGTNLHEEFKISENLDFGLVLDEESPTASFATFCDWILPIMDKLTDMVRVAKVKPEFSYRWFIDQRNETFSDLVSWVDDVYAHGLKKWKETFPLRD